MDDRRLDQALSLIDRPADADPAFLGRLYEDLAGQLGFRGDAVAASAAAPVPTPAADGRVPADGRRRTARPWRSTLLLAAGLAGAATVGLLAGAAIERWRGDQQPSLLDTIRSERGMTVAVTTGRPQAHGPDGRFEGFDTDVARLLADRLLHDGLPVSAQIRARDGITIDDLGTDWQVGLPATGLAPHDPARFGATAPISFWPIRVIVPAAAPVARLDDLAGSAVCVVRGSSGEAWLTGRPVDSATPLVPPPAATADLEPDDDACLDALAAGTVSAVVTASLDPAGLAVRGDLRAIGGPVLTEERRAFVPLGGGDATELLHALDAAIEAARADGSLADLARSRFGGVDLSAPPSSDPVEEQP